MKAYQIKISVLGTDPLVWRRVILPADATFHRLHDTIQNSLNFKSGYPYVPGHLFEFHLPEENMRVTNDEEAYEEHIAFKKNRKQVEKHYADMPAEFAEFGQTHLANLNVVIRQPKTLKFDSYLEKYKKITYSYDFGDDWNIEILLEDTIDDYHFGYPTLVDGAEDAPPEDVGGIAGFYQFLEAYRNIDHLDHAKAVEWADAVGFHEYDSDLINRNLKSVKYKKTEWDKLM